MDSENTIKQLICAGPVLTLTHPASPGDGWAGENHPPPDSFGAVDFQSGITKALARKQTKDDAARLLAALPVEDRLAVLFDLLAEIE